MGLITEWFKWLHSLQESEQSPLLKLPPEDQTELLNALRAYPMHPRFHKFCHMFEYKCPVPGAVERMRVPSYSFAKAFDLKQIGSTLEQRERESEEAFRQRERAFQEEADKNRREYEAKEQKAAAEREKLAEKKRRKERRIAEAEERKARVTYEPRCDGLIEEEGRVWAGFVQARRKEPRLPKPKGKASVRKLPAVPEEPKWEYPTNAAHQQWEARVQKIRSTR